MKPLARSLAAKATSIIRRRFFKPVVLRVLLALVVVMLISAGVLSVSNPTSSARTRPDHPDPRLHTRRYRGSREAVRGVLQSIVPQLRTYGRRWRLMTDASPDMLRAEVPVLVFTDDLTVTLREENGEVRLDVHSQSRVGRGDLGENRRHILQLLDALDSRL